MEATLCISKDNKLYLGNMDKVQIPNTPVFDSLESLQQYLAKEGWRVVKGHYYQVEESL